MHTRANREKSITDPDTVFKIWSQEFDGYYESGGCFVLTLHPFITGRSGDHSFWGTGIPSLFMGISEQEPSSDPTSLAFAKMFNTSNSGGFGWWWHTTEDTLDKIDPKFLKRDCEIYLLAVYRSLTDPVIPVNH